MDPQPQQEYDEAMFVFSQGDYAGAVAKLEALLRAVPECYEARLSLAMAYSRLGEVARAIEEGHKAESLSPDDSLAHTNLSLFYLQAGDKEKAERHGLRARIAGWKNDASPPTQPADSDLSLARPAPKTYRTPEKFPDMPWKKQDPARKNGPA